jgi:transposase, IS30 family
MRSYVRIQKSERRVIQKMLYEHKTIRGIARFLSRTASTICRELKRNRTYGYNAIEAEIKSQERISKRIRTIEKYPELSAVIEDLLRGGNSPEVISGYYLKIIFKEYPTLQVSHETIYQWLYLCARPLLRYLFTKRKKRQNRRNIYKNRGKDITKRNICERPETANKKQEYGHLEGDLIVSAGNNAYLLTLVDRKNSFIWGVKSPVKDADVIARAVIEALEDIPSGYVKSITFDNGSEFSLHKEIEKALSCKVYFADPYSSWQRGLNEHINGRIRYYLPKKKSFACLTDEKIDSIINIINNRPRKSLNWITPSEVFSSVALAP